MSSTFVPDLSMLTDNFIYDIGLTRIYSRVWKETPLKFRMLYNYLKYVGRNKFELTYNALPIKYIEFKGTGDPKVYSLAIRAEDKFVDLFIFKNDIIFRGDLVLLFCESVQLKAVDHKGNPIKACMYESYDYE
jgi:hypothetical protein